jgi:hypothetical protein
VGRPFPAQEPFWRADSTIYLVAGVHQQADGSGFLFDREILRHFRRELVRLP